MSNHSRNTYHARFASTAEAMAFEAWNTDPAWCDVTQLPRYVSEALAGRRVGFEPPADYWAWLEARLDMQRAGPPPWAPAPDVEPEPCSECGGRGWDVFDAGHHGLEIERCDGCAMFPDDDEAIYAALKWWLGCESWVDDAAKFADPEELLIALLNSSAGIAIAAMEPSHDRAQQAAQARVGAALERCGHSACSQHYIDTGDVACIDSEVADG